MVIAKYWDKIRRPAYALNEGGKAVLGKDGKMQYVAVQVSEKVFRQRPHSPHRQGRSRVHADEGQSRRPSRAAAVDKIGSYNTPVHLTSVVRRYFEALAPLEDEETSKWMRVIDTSDRGEHAQRCPRRNQSDVEFHDDETPSPPPSCKPVSAVM